MPFGKFRSAFTLIELLVVIAIIAILAVVVVLTLNPAELLRQSRDANRVSDLATLNTALGLYTADQVGATGFSLGSSSVAYPSLLDPAGTSLAGTACASLGLLAMPTSSWSYHCAASSTQRAASGFGWIPVNFQGISSGSPLSSLPVDPVNASSSRLYYSYATDGTGYDLSAALESAKYRLGGSNDVVSADGSILANTYEKGTKPGLEPLDYGDPSLAGYWPLDEGSGAVAYDWSGNNANGSWLGGQVGTSGYYSPGEITPWAGTFDGTSTFVAISATMPYLTYTKIVWIYATGLTSGYDNIMSGQYYAFGASGGHLQGGHNGSWGLVVDPATLSLNTWYLVAITYDGTTLRLYKDGVLVSSASAPPPTNSSNFRIGAFATSNNFLGLMDNARMYSRALSGAEIQALYNAQK